MAVWPIQQRNVVGIVLQLSRTEKNSYEEWFRNCYFWNAFHTLICPGLFIIIIIIIIIIIVIIIIIIIIIIIFNLQKVWNLTSHINPRI